LPQIPLPAHHVQLLAFCVATAVLAFVSREALRRPKSHGFYRFIAFEAIAGLVVLNYPVWRTDPWSVHQWVSYPLLIASVGLVLNGLYLLKKVGKPTPDRPDAELFGFEKTSALVTSGVFRYIRHPMYASLLFLAWGAFCKDVSWVGLGLAGLATLALLLTALRDEAECLAHFGDAYARYMRRTKRFVPFVF
jgi:protein-S-isoprenylcysteine O-methyltransferase Ste14